MASDPGTVAHVCDQMQGAGQITWRKMFGEYAVYCDGKVVALICGNQTFLKATPTTQALLPDAGLAPPYPGAKPHLLLDDVLEDTALLTRAVAALAAELPMPKPKKPRASKAKPKG
ncbi:TfoX/Sxy family protein [Fertoebacter nigrum]|uniref:TfoX/Sxy family protein n=1 Tax=Fertoeibacter niger TaxID=2656921 RepID=A0A8X8GZK5_9RHOB|nr:TfoX/Sxy family protein [Fertoeibacter niger]NUB44773.1 TfoX/Sxy family protein [Fertoeibacter niger]